MFHVDAVICRKTLFPAVLMMTLVFVLGFSHPPSLAAQSSSEPKYYSTFYFAEGYTGEGFDEYLIVGNPNNKDAPFEVRYMFKDGSTVTKHHTVEEQSQFSIWVNTEIGSGREVSSIVRSVVPNLVAERVMDFNYGGQWDGGSAVVGATGPSRTWYFAEGTTRTSFDSFLCIQNPQKYDTRVTLNYMIENEGLRPVTIDLSPTTRMTVNVAGQIGREKDFSVKVESQYPIVAERPMYFNYQGLNNNNWTGGHGVMGITAPRYTFCFAEGATYSNFEEWLCLQNPNTSPTEVQATYMTGGGESISKTYQVLPHQRKTISVNQEVGWNKDVSVVLISNASFVAERPIYFDYHGPNNYSYTGGHDVIGANLPSQEYLFAEGDTDVYTDEWFCIQNPSEDPANLKVKYLFLGKGTKQTTHVIPPKSRGTIYVNRDAGDGKHMSARITSDVSIVAERAIYFPQGLSGGGHDVVGYAIKELSLGTIKITDSRVIDDEIGDLLIHGTLKNNTVAPIRFAKIAGSLLDSSGGVISSKSTYADLDIIDPGGTSSFCLIFTKPESYRKFTLATDYEFSGSLRNRDVVITSESSYRDDWYYHVVGVVKNKGSVTHKYPEICIAFYDAEGQLLTTDTAFPALETLSPGRSSSFESQAFNYEGAQSIASYRIVGVSCEY